MSRHDHDLRPTTPALERARSRELARRRQQTRQAGAPSPLDVNVEDLADGALDIDTAITAAAVTELLDEGKEIEWTADADAPIKLHLENEAGMVHASGTAHFSLRHPCVRCLNPVPFDVPLDVDLRLARADGDDEGILPEEEAGAGALDSLTPSAGELEDIGVASYTGDTVHLAEVLREQLFLELPMHPACDSPRARPTEPCSFDASGALKQEQERWIDPRWAGLLKLKDQLVSSSTVHKPAPSPAPATVPLPGRATVVPLPGRRPSPPAPAAPKPAAKKAKPAAKKPKPAAKEAKPAAKKPKPAAKKPKPAAKKAKPAAKKVKPAAKKVKPVGRTSKKPTKAKRR